MGRLFGSSSFEQTICFYIIDFSVKRKYNRINERLILNIKELIESEIID